MNQHSSWQTFLNAEQEKDYFKTLVSFVQSRRDEGRDNTSRDSKEDSKVNVYPPEPLVFNAFRLTSLNEVKVVILGQDPYHGAGQAQGLSFSVPNGEKVPPSLRNIYKELCTDIDGFAMPHHGNLNAWAEQGVLLLNTVLTVEEGQANSHKGKGWEQFTDTAISYLSMHTKGIVFLLWGKPAQTKIKLIDTEKHHVLTSAHPSPLSAYRGFFGCKHFSQANDLLVKLGKPEVNWQVP